MKKFVSIALALVLTLSLTVVAFAAVATTGETSQTIAVTVEAKATNDNYAAVVTWDLPATDMVYKTAGKTWNTETLEWDVAAGDAAGWAEEYDRSGSVTVANRSSQDITVAVASNNAAVAVANADYAGTIGDATAGTAVEEVWTITVDADVITAYEATITVTIS